LDDVKAHYVAKRALEIAAAGNHSILLVGPRAVGKASLKQGAELELGLNGVIVCDSCACGNHTAVRAACICNAIRLERWQRRLRTIAREVDIQVECAEVPYKEMASPYTEDHTGYRADRIKRAREFTAANARDYSLDDVGERTREMIARRLGFGVGEMQRMMSVARTIADLDQSAQIKAKHLAEACQYRTAIRA